MKLKLYLLLYKILPLLFLRKLVIKYQRLANWLKYGDKYFPHDIAIEIGTKCNRTCSYCPQSAAPAGNIRMSEVTFMKVIQAMKEIKWTGPISFNHFNETLLDKRIVWFVQQTKAALPKCSPRIYTNGDALTEPLAEQLIDAGLFRFVITNHDSHFKPFSERILKMAQRWPNHFFLSDLREATKAGTGGYGRMGGYTNPKPEDNIQFEVKTTCDNPEGSMHIATDGGIMLCCCDYTHSYVYGNAIDDGIMKAWNNPEFKRVRNEVRNGKPRLDICKGCFGLQKNVLAGARSIITLPGLGAMEGTPTEASGVLSGM